MKKKIIYVGNFALPNLNAAGKRVMNIGKCFNDLGYSTIYIGNSIAEEISEILFDTRIEFSDFISYNYKYPNKIRDWIKYNDKFKQLESVIYREGLENIYAVIIYNSPALSLFNGKLINFCKKNGIKIISDCTDWLTSETGNLFFDLFKNVDTWIQRKVYNKRCDGMIVISDYLYSFYNEKPCILIPPTGNRRNTEIADRKDTDFKTKLIYAGIPFRIGKKIKKMDSQKDRLDLVVKSIAKVKNKNYVLNIVGLTKQDYLTAFPNHKEIIEIEKSNIIFNGKCTQEETEQMVSESDYSIVLRNSKRDTIAGFPTKVSESILNGIPVISTDTGDIGKYIIDSFNGFIVDTEKNNITEKLESIMLISNHSLLEIKRNCANDKSFYWKTYTSELRSFLEKLDGKIQ